MRATEALLAETDWLRRLASRLIRDPAAADDLAQETLLAAMRHGPRRASGLRPWLATVARNLAGKQKTREVNRKQREAIVARAEALPSTLDSVERFVMHQSVVNAVMTLDEPYRTTILLRFWEDLTVGEIASRMDAPIETVRTRLKRGVEKLRARLDREHGTRAAWVGPLLTLPGVREAMKVTASVSTTGGLVMMKKIGIGAAMLLVCSLVIWLWTSGATGEPSSPEAGGSVAASLDGTARPAAVERERAVADARDDARETSESTGLGSLELRVHYSDGEAAATVGIYVRGAGSALGKNVTTNEAGEATLVDLSPGRYSIVLDRCSGRSVEIAPDTRSKCLIEIPASVTIVGKVVNLEGQPVAHARVYRETEDHEDFAVRVATCDEHGEFVVRDIERDAEVFARADGWQSTRGRSHASRGLPGTKTELILKVGARAETVRGRVVLASGKPAAHALIGFAVDEDTRKRTDGLREIRRSEGGAGQPLDRDGFLLRADASGRFETSELTAGEALMLARSQSEPYEVGSELFLIQRGRNAELVLKLQPAGSVVGRIVDEHGSPCARASIRSEWKGSELYGQLERGIVCRFAEHVVQTNEDGEYTIEGMLPGETRIEHRIGGRRHERKTVTVAAGSTVRADMSVKPAWGMRVRVTRDGQPVRGWAIAAYPAGAFRYWDLGSIVTDSEGRARFPGLREASLIVSLHAPTDRDGFQHFERLPSWQGSVREGTGRLEIRVGGEKFRTASITATVLSSSPLSADARVELRRVGSWNGRGAKLRADGRLAFRALPAGEYELVIRHAGHVELRERVELEAGEALDLGPLRLFRASRVRIAVLDVAGAPTRAARVEIVELGPKRGALGFNSKDRVFVSEAIRPGSYTVRVTANGMRDTTLELRVREGEVVRQRVRLRRDSK